MTIRSGFFNSVNGDRKYDAKRFAEYFTTFIGNGVFPNPSTNFQVVSNNDMTVTVKPGKAWINGYVAIDDEDYILQLDPADGALNRIDRIVLKWDAVDREIRIEVKKGTFASTPVVPSLQRDADAYELGIADIRINKGAVSITQANITDLRLSTELCGIVHGLVEQVDTEVLFQDYQAWIEQKKGEFNSDLIDYTVEKQQELDTWYNTTTTEFEDNFNAWFDTIQDILDENVAGNLLSIINQFKDTKGQPNGIASLDIDAQVPVEQLGNVEYMKDWYGRGVIEYEPKTLLGRDKLVLETDILSKAEIEYFDWSPIPTSLTNTGLDTYFSLEDVFLETSHRTGSVQNFGLVRYTNGDVYIYGRTSSSASTGTIVISSIKPIDLTGIKKISIKAISNGDTHLSYARFGVGTSNLNTSTNKQVDIPSSGTNDIVLNVEELTGLYYIKIVVGSTTLETSKTFGFTLRRSFKLKPIVEPTLLFKNTGITLVDNELSESLLLPQTIIPQRALDWYSLNALVDTPPNTSVEYNLYDNHNNLLKGDIQNGDTFKHFSNPILVPQIILNRNNLSDSKPKFERLTLGYRGDFTGFWSDLIDIELDVATPEIVFEIPDGIEELDIIVNSTTIGGTLMYLRFNSDSTATSHVSNIIGYNSSSAVFGTKILNTYCRLSDNSATIQNMSINIKNIIDGMYTSGFCYLNSLSVNHITYGVFGYMKKDKITQVSIIASGGQFAIGSKFKVRGR